MGDNRTSTQQIGVGAIQDYQIDFGSGPSQVDINDIAPLSLKGDLLTYDGASHVALNVSPTDGDVLISDSASPSGIKWGASTLLSIPHGIKHTDGTDNVDGDQLVIDFLPTNYSPDISILEATDIKDLSSHLKGLDNSIINTYKFKNIFTPSSGQTVFSLSSISNNPAKSIFKINGQVNHYVTDYTINGTILTYLNNGYKIDSTDNVEILYS